MAARLDAPVLVVGAGPVGLALAGDLAWRGVPSLIVDRGDGSIYQPKMDLVGVRTMEFCRRWGIVDWVEQSPYTRDYPQDNVYVTSVTGWELGRERVPAMAEASPPPQSPQHRERCPQDMFDPILRRFATSFDEVDLRYGTELVRLVEHDDHVEAELLDVDSGTTSVARVEWVVGCDGAGSTVRDLAGIPMSGTPALTYTTNVIFRCPDFASLHDKGLLYRFIIIGDEGTWATIVAINGADRWRFSIIGDEQPRVLTEDDIHAAIRRAVGIDFDYELLTVVPWTRRELVADRYRAGRLFIAGDAAHVMSPTGGFGMNTGIGDAVDLAWKLDATINGWAGAQLLDSYERERRPVGARNVAEASGNLARMLSPRTARPPAAFLDDTPEGAEAREKVGAEFSEAMRREWHTLGIHLGYRYDDSPVVVPDGSIRPPLEVMTYTQRSLPGARAPHVWLSPGRSTLDLFGRGFVLLRLGADAPTGSTIAEAAAARCLPLTTTTLDQPDAIAAYERALVLVRPDGHVAWRGDTEPPDAKLLIDTIRGAP
ncbi:MAG: FAD-dependent oxidoreductase [Acidobacteria bacterium]|nr:FAD-dependent oxidoreductase [Acidobacteriota bacterium]